MLKNVLGVIGGYVFVIIFSMASLWVVYSLMGIDFAFKPESYQASTRWALTSVILGFVGAVLAGLVCFMISKSQGAVKVLAGLFLVLGLALALFTITQKKPTTKREPDLSFIAAGEQAYSPDWYNFVIPFVGAAGAMIGGRLKKEE